MISAPVIHNFLGNTNQVLVPLGKLAGPRTFGPEKKSAQARQAHQGLSKPTRPEIKTRPR